MPSSPEHLDKAERNKHFLMQLPTDPCSQEWGAVVAFYIAVHLVERVFSKRNIHCSSHSKRMELLSRREYRAIYSAMQALKDASQIARYGTVSKFGKAFPNDTVEKILIKTHLAAVEAFVDAVFLTHPSP